MNIKAILMFSHFSSSLRIVVLLSFLITSCGEAITESSTQTFTQPQPVNTKTLLQFPNALRGKYLSQNDSSFIKIDSNFIIRTYENWGKISNAEFDSSFVWVKDSVIEKGAEQKYWALKEKDSVSILICFQDTIVRLNASTTILKKFKTNYFLNLQQSNHNWNVKMMTLSKGKLILSCVIDTANHHFVDTFSSDTIVNIPEQPKPLNLSKKEFKRYVRHDNFEDAEVLLKVE